MINLMIIIGIMLVIWVVVSVLMAWLAGWDSDRRARAEFAKRGRIWRKL